MKIIAWYLPQYHETEENNIWWGKGFTEWTNVKKAKPLYQGHYQPRKPLDGYYYDLSDWMVMKKQAEMAQEYGLYGFCFYHYWFSGKKLLYKPLENYLSHKDIDFRYCISWANESWTNAWVSDSKKILMQQDYGGEEDWKRHFEYLKQYFFDSRYIKIDECPLIIIYRPELIDCLDNMLRCWRKLAIDCGLKGLKIAYQHVSYHCSRGDKKCFDFGIEYQPIYAMRDTKKQYERIIDRIKEKTTQLFQNIFGNSISIKRKKVIRINYEKVWRGVIERKNEGGIPMIPGAFTDWDNTPRRGIKGTVFDGAPPNIFKEFFVKQIENVKKNYNTDYLFIFAWNEWAEGGYLEPDEKYEYGYLEAIKESLISCDEWREF